MINPKYGYDTSSSLMAIYLYQFTQQNRTIQILWPVLGPVVIETQDPKAYHAHSHQ